MADRVLLKNCAGFHGQIVDLFLKKKIGLDFHVLWSR